MKSIPVDCWDKLQHYQCLAADVCAAFHHDSVEIHLQVGSHSLKLDERGFSHPALSFTSPVESLLDLDGLLKQELCTADDARKSQQLCWGGAMETWKTQELTYVSLTLALQVNMTEIMDSDEDDDYTFKLWATVIVVVVVCVGRRELAGFASVLRKCFLTLLHTHHNEHKRINSVGFLTHLCSFACCQHRDSQIQQGQQRSLLRVTRWWESTADTSLVFWAASPHLKVGMRSSMRRSLQPKSLGILVVLF